MNFLEMLRESQIFCGINETDSLLGIDGKSDPNDIIFCIFFNQEIDELISCHDWTCLQRKHYVEPKKNIKRSAKIKKNSTKISLDNTKDIIEDGMLVEGDGIPFDARVVRVGDGVVIEIDQECTKTDGAAEITFTQDTFDLPEDFRKFLDGTFWSQNSNFPIEGPTSPSQWQRVEINYLFSSVNATSFFRMIGDNKFRISKDSGTISFEYISDFSVIDENKKIKKKLKYNEDKCILDNNLIIRGVISRYFIRNGFDSNYQNSYQDYRNYRSRMIANDSPGGKIDLCGGSGGFGRYNFIQRM